MATLPRTPMPRARLAAAPVLFVLLLAVEALTQAWRSWNGGIALLTARDVFSYEAIAAAAPGLPSADLPAQHAERWVPHRVLGTLSDWTGVSIHVVDAVALAAVAV